MAPCGVWAKKTHVRQTHTAMAAVEAIEFYVKLVPQEVQAIMSALEKDVKIIRKARDDEEVDTCSRYGLYSHKGVKTL